MCIRDRNEEYLAPRDRFAPKGAGKAAPLALHGIRAVSYTHLDVYKRQELAKSRIKYLTVAPMFAEAIERTYQEISIAKLFN